MAETISHDLSNLIGAIGAAGIDPTDTVFIAGPREASLIESLTETDTLMSLGVPSKTVIAIGPSGIASGFQGPPEITTSKHPTLHRETNPQPIVSSGGVPAVPSTGLFQSYMLAVSGSEPMRLGARHPERCSSCRASIGEGDGCQNGPPGQRDDDKA
jgi:hypothetical protein